MAITKILNINAEDGRNPATHLKAAIDYIQNPDKTECCNLEGSINCSPDTAFEQMMETKQTFGKTDKRQGYHTIISFDPEEPVTTEQARYVAENFIHDVLGGKYEVVYAIHTDKEHMHIHIEEQTQERFERIVEQMKQAHGITEQLKADNELEWIGKMNNMQACAREIVDKEMIYQ